MAHRSPVAEEFVAGHVPLWYPIAERFDDEGESGATLERPKRVFGVCCVAVVWNRKRDGLDIKLIPHSALEGDDSDPSGPIMP